MSFNISNTDSTKMYAVCMDLRFGAMAFATSIEYGYFPPSDQVRSDQYSITPVNWNNNIWYVISIPLNYRKEALRTASDLGLKLVGGVPTMFHGDKKREYFPIKDGENVYTLENRERPPFHKIPYMTETQLKVEIIRKAARLWNVDFSTNIEAVESLVHLDDKEATVTAQNIIYKLADDNNKTNKTT